MKKKPTWNEYTGPVFTPEQIASIPRVPASDFGADGSEPEPLSADAAIRSLRDGHSAILLTQELGELLYRLRHENNQVDLRRVCRAITATKRPGRERTADPWRMRLARNLAAFLRTLDRHLCRYERREGIAAGSICTSADILDSMQEANCRPFLELGRHRDWYLDLLAATRADRRLYRGKPKKKDPRLTALEKLVAERLPE